MAERDRKHLKEIHTFPALVKYLREGLGWPVEQDSFDDLDEITFDWAADELGIDPEQAAKIEYIKQLRPLENGQPQGVFFVKFDSKSLPVVALRRLLGKLVVKKRATAAAAERPLWAMRDLVFISSYGESDERQLSFAYFQEPEHKSELPSLKVLGWDDRDTALHLDRVHDQLAAHLTWPESAKALPTWRKGWSAAFELRHGEIVTTAKQLAEQLAALARGIRERANQLLKLETENGPLRTLMAGFKMALIHDLTEDQFADMYAQTIAYGLLSARITHPDQVKAETLPDLIPVTNPFLKELMETFVLAGGKHRGRKRGLHLDFDELGINDVVELLRRANMDAVLRNFGADDRKEDPVTYFYEDFLNAYDAQERKRRGVYYTPRPVVSYIVRSVHELLKTEFGIEDGLASTITWDEMMKRHKDLKIPQGVTTDSPFVQILDPATGTATFLVMVIEIIFDTLTARWKREGLSEARRFDAWNEYVPKHLLPRLYGYELMMAPYAIAHLKIGLKLFETGYRFGSEERARIYLTNALEPASDASYSQIDALSGALAHEAQAVNAVKRRERFAVVIGNPPYSGHSANASIENGHFTYIGKLVRDYSLVDGKPLGERNPKWLQDDYVKFVRLSQRFVTDAGLGVVGVITNHGYLDNPTFRGMRQQLKGTYNSIYVLDLHGNSNKKERAPNGSKDDNVFDIQQGVAISLMVCDGDTGLHQVRRADLWGSRDDKYKRLTASGVHDLAFKSLTAAEPNFNFFAQNTTTLAEYSAGQSIAEAMPVNTVGIVTGQDEVAIAFTREDAEKLAQSLHVPANAVRPILYRPFDSRFIVYAPQAVTRRRFEVMRHMLAASNVGIITTRTTKDAWGAYVTSTLCGHKTCSAYDINYLFPLSLYPTAGGEEDLLSGTSHRQSNIDTGFAEAFVAHLGLKWRPDRDDEARTNSAVGPRDVLNYIYGVFYSSGYRSRYSDFLERDFPRVPFTGTLELFRLLSRLGGELVALHLLESPELDDFITTYSGPKNPEVGRVGWSDDTVWLDAAAIKKGHDATAGTIGIHGVPEAVWNFHIGGYQVCEKWLKDRKGRKLLDADIEHYQKIVVALSETIRIMREIDEVIENLGGWPGAFQAGSGRAN